MSNINKRKVLGLDLGSNSIGWALLEEVDKRPQSIIDLGCRIFTKAVEDKTPTPKNVSRRNEMSVKNLPKKNMKYIST